MSRVYFSCSRTSIILKSICNIFSTKENIKISPSIMSGPNLIYGQTKTMSYILWRIQIAPFIRGALFYAQTWINFIWFDGFGNIANVLGPSHCNRAEFSLLSVNECNISIGAANINGFHIRDVTKIRYSSCLNNPDLIKIYSSYARALILSGSKHVI